MDVIIYGNKSYICTELAYIYIYIYKYVYILIYYSDITWALFQITVSSIVCSTARWG